MRSLLTRFLHAREAMAAANLSITDFVDVGIECTLRQLLEHGFFHAGARLAWLPCSCLGTLLCFLLSSRACAQAGALLAPQQGPLTASASPSPYSTPNPSLPQPPRPTDATPDPHPGNLLATADGTLVYLDFGMMSEAPQYARFAIISHVVHLVNRWGAHNRA